MKILHCLAQLPSNTGSGIYYHTLVNGFEQRGHENALIYGIQRPFVADFDEKFKKYPIEFKSEALKFPIAGMSDEMPYDSTCYSKMSEKDFDAWIDAFKKALYRVKEEFNPDIIISHHIFILTSLVREIFNDKKVIGISHGTDIRQVKKNPWIKEKYIKNVDKLDYYISLSQKDKKDLEEVFNIPYNRIEILGGGFKEEYFYENKKENKRENKKIKIFYAGKLSQAKGIYEFASAIEILNKKYNNVEIFMIGNADENIKKKIEGNSKNAKNIYFLNSMSQKQLGEFMRKSDIFVLPSYYEGLGLIAIEALACGLRVVSTKIVGLQELLKDRINLSGVIEYVDLPRLYDVDKPYEEDKEKFIKSLSDKISIQIDRINNGEEIIKDIKLEIHKHSWNNIITKIDDIIKNEVNKK